MPHCGVKETVELLLLGTCFCCSSWRLQPFPVWLSPDQQRQCSIYRAEGRRTRNSPYVLVGQKKSRVRIFWPCSFWFVNRAWSNVHTKTKDMCTIFDKLNSVVQTDDCMVVILSRLMMILLCQAKRLDWSCDEDNWVDEALQGPHCHGHFISSEILRST